jgi:hypothetical protein
MYANDPDPAPTPIALWRTLREYICTFWNLFGAPLDIARQVWLRRDEARVLADALRPLEMMLRRLVFLDALEAPVPALAQTRARQHMPRARRESFNLEDSETWRVSFDLGLDRRRPRRNLSETDLNMPAGAPALQRPRLPNADLTAPLARRAEALLRGFNHPASLVTRMARLLARDRWRAQRILCGVPKRDRAKPFFHQVAQTIALAHEAFQAWLHKQLNACAVDSS